MDTTEQRKTGRRVVVLVTVGLLAAATIIGIVAMATQAADRPVPRNVSDGAITISSARGSDDASLDIRIYLDYSCPYCAEFDEANGALLGELVADGTAVVHVHPVAIFDSASGGAEYSTRSANAAVCVVDGAPTAYLSFHELLFRHQPPQDGPGLDDDTLVALASQAGAGEPAVADCIRGQKFEEWLRTATDEALSSPVPDSDVGHIMGTPTIVVNGQEYDYRLGSDGSFDPDEFEAFLREIAGETVAP